MVGKLLHFYFKKSAVYPHGNVLILITLVMLRDAWVTFAHVPLLLCSIFGVVRVREKSAILKVGENECFGAILKAFGASLISPFVATPTICAP